MLHDRQSHQLDRISIDPRVMVGKPVVRGTRIPVERVLQHLAENDRDDVFAAFPELTEEDVRACFAYAWEALVRERERGVLAGSVGRP